MELAGNPDTALATVVHAMLLNVLFPYSRNESSLEISVTHTRLEPSMKAADASAAMLELVKLKEEWADHIPGDPAHLWDWCLDRRRDELLKLLAYAASYSVNAVKTKFHQPSKALAHANQLGLALNVDMGRWFETTADSYFQHLNRQSIEAAVAEVRGADFAKGIADKKKAEAVAYAAKAVKGYGWIPGPMALPHSNTNQQHPLPEAAE